MPAPCDRATVLRPGDDHLVADIVEDLAAIILDRNGEQAKDAIEQAMDSDTPKPLRQRGRSHDVDEQHEALFLDRHMIAPADEVQESASADQAGNSQDEI